MKITVTVDDEIVKKVRKIAVDKNTTLTAMVREYLTSIADDATPDEAVRKESIAKVQAHIASIANGDAAASGTTAGKEAADKFMESVRQLSRPMGPRNWTRDDLYDRPRAYFKRD